MRLCYICKKNPKLPYSSQCKECHNTYQKTWHKKHPNTNKDSQKNRRRLAEETIKRLKDVPCADCGVKYPTYVMDFDHLRDKEFNIGISVARGLSVNKILLEASKCEVVCANCHRIRTFNRSING